MQTKIDVGVIGQSPKNKPVAKFIRNLGHFAALIQQRDLDRELYEEVMKVAKGYPEGSLDYIYNNLDSIINKCQTNLIIKNRPGDEVHQPILEKPKYVTEQPKIKTNIVETTKTNYVDHPKINETTNKVPEKKQVQKQPEKPVVTWIPGTDPELEEYRQKLKFLRENNEAIMKDIEERRKAIGEAPPMPQSLRGTPLN